MISATSSGWRASRGANRHPGITVSWGLYGSAEIFWSRAAFSSADRAAPTTFGVAAVRPNAASNEIARGAGVPSPARRVTARRRR